MQWDLAEAAGADDCKTIEHLWRCPGTLNWPDEKKILAGRDPAPFLTHWLKIPDGGAVGAAELRSKLPASTYKVAAVDSTFEWNVRAHPDKPAERLSEDQIRWALAAVKPERSVALAKFIRRCLLANYTPDEIADTLLEHDTDDYPAVGKYNGSEDRIRADVRRIAISPDPTKSTSWEGIKQAFDSDETADAGAPGAKPDADAGSTPSRFKFLRRQDYADFRMAPPLFPGIIAAEEPFQVVGRQSALKSFVGCEFGFSSCTALPAFGRWKPELSPGWFVYCVAEGQDGFKAKRVRAWEIAHNIDLNDHPFLLLPTVPLALPDGAEEAAFCAALDPMLGDIPVRFMLFDTMAHMSGGANANHEHEIKLVGLMLKRIAERYKAAVGMIAHPAKHDKGSDSARGSQVNQEMFSNGLKVERQGEKVDLLTKLTVLKNRDGEDGAEYLLKGRLVSFPVPPEEGKAPETYTSIVMELATGKDAARHTGKPDKSGTRLALRCLCWMSAWGKASATPEELYLAEWRFNDWSADADAHSPVEILKAPRSEAEEKAWPAGQKRLARLANARKTHFGTTRVASKPATAREWTWFPHVAAEISPDEGDDE